jgi:hypothetical protein
MQYAGSRTEASTQSLFQDVVVAVLDAVKHGKFDAFHTLFSADILYQAPHFQRHGVDALIAPGARATISGRNSAPAHGNEGTERAKSKQILHKNLDRIIPILLAILSVHVPSSHFVVSGVGLAARVLISVACRLLFLLRSFLELTS